MATPTIPNGEEFFFPVIYSGNGMGKRIGQFVPFTDSGSISKSVLYNKADTAALTKTYSGEGNKTKFTISFWFKPTLVADYGILFGASTSNDAWNATTGSYFYMSGYSIVFYSGGTNYFKTSRTFEDTGKWYNFVCAIDTSESGTDKIKVYVDGEQVTSFAIDARSSISGDLYIGDDVLHFIGGQPTTGTTAAFWDGYFAEVNYLDGQALTPSTFGLTDTSTGRWIPKALTGITYGTNGVRLQFGSPSALGDDTSGNTNDYSVANLVASDQRNDTPTNNLPTMRPYNPSYSQTFSEGNLQHATTGSNTGYPVVSTLQPKGSGKFYAECRASDAPGGYNLTFGCFAAEDLHNYSSGGVYPGNANYGSGLWVESNQYVRWNGVTSYTNYTPFTFSAGDVIGLALDLDIGLLSFYDDDNSLIGSITWDREKSACFGAVSNKAVTFIWNFGDNPTFNLSLIHI